MGTENKVIVQLQAAEAEAKQQLDAEERGSNALVLSLSCFPLPPTPTHLLK